MLPYTYHRSIYVLHVSSYNAALPYHRQSSTMPEHGIQKCAVFWKIWRYDDIIVVGCIVLSKNFVMLLFTPMCHTIGFVCVCVFPFFSVVGHQ